MSANDPWRQASNSALAALAEARRTASPAPPPQPTGSSPGDWGGGDPSTAPPTDAPSGWDGDLPPTSEEAAHDRVSLHLEKIADAAAEREAQREVVRQSQNTPVGLKNRQIADLNRADMRDLVKAERIMEVVQNATTNGGKATANLTTIIAERSGDLDEALAQVEKLKGTTILDEFPVSLPLLRQNLESIFGRKRLNGWPSRPPRLSPRLQELHRAQLEGHN